MTLAVPSPTLVTSVTRVTPGQPSWLPTLPTPWARDDRGQLRCGVRRSGPDSFAAEHHVLVQQVREPGLFGQFHDRDQSGAGHQILVIEHGRAVTPGMPQFHRKCPSDPRRLGLQQTYCRRSKGTFVISTQSVATLVHGFRLSGGEQARARELVELLAPFWADALRFGASVGVSAYPTPRQPNLGRALLVAHGLDDPRLATMLLRPFRPELLTPADAPVLAAVADRYGEGWMSELLAEWDLGGSRGWYRTPQERLSWIAALPELCLALNGAGGSGVADARRAVGADRRPARGRRGQRRIRAQRYRVRVPA